MSRAMRCAVAGVALVLAAEICSGLNLLSAQQTISLALPGSLLAASGLMASTAVPEDEIAELGFQAGYLLGTLLAFWRSASGRQDVNLGPRPQRRELRVRSNVLIQGIRLIAGGSAQSQASFAATPEPAPPCRPGIGKRGTDQAADGQHGGRQRQRDRLLRAHRVTRGQDECDPSRGCASADPPKRWVRAIPPRRLVRSLQPAAISHLGPPHARALFRYVPYSL